MMTVFALFILAISVNAHSGMERVHKKSVGIRTSSIPSGWTKQSCIIDSSSQRVLGSYHTTSNSNTPTNCIDTCNGKGYSYAGVEFGTECWCSNSVSQSGNTGTATSSSDCSQQCPGDKTQQCGSGNRLQVYHKTSSSSSPPPPPSSSSGGDNYGLGPKIGLAWGGAPDQLKNWKTSSVGSMYNWGADCPPEAKQAGIDCYPMLWGQKNAADFKKKVVPGYGKVILGQNEPNQNGQSNMTPEEGVKLWKEYIEPMKAHGYKLCSPATSSAPNGYTWVEEFFKICGPDKCQVDFICLHWYDIGFTKFKTYIEKFHDGFGLPIMVTEFADQNFNGGPQASASEVETFLEQATQWMEETEWIVKYFWFGVLPDMQGVNQKCSLWDNGHPNALGKKYIKN